MTLRRKPGPPDWPGHEMDAGAPADARSRTRGLLVAGSVVLIAIALAAVGPWSAQTRMLIPLLGWVAAVIVGGWAYRGRSRHASSVTKVLLGLAVISVAGAAALVLISLQVRDIIAGSVTFGDSGRACEIASEAAAFVEGDPVYQVAHLSRRTRPSEVISLLLLRDDVAEVLASEAAPLGFDCLGGAIEPAGPGRYRLEVRAADELLASGSFEVIADER